MLIDDRWRSPWLPLLPMASAWAATPLNHVPRALSAFIALEGCNGRLFSSSSTQLDDDPYKVLRVPRNATFQEIKVCYSFRPN
jgi:hypothetical protein